jgi:hypothetical protein
MAVLVDVDADSGCPWDGDVMCSACKMIFTVSWKHRADVDGVSYCPFCGEEIDSVEPKGGA